MGIIGMIGLKRLKLFNRVAFLQSFEFHGFKYFLDKNFTVTWLHEWYQIYDIFSSFFFFQLLAFMDSQEGLEEFNETPTQSFTTLLQGGHQYSNENPPQPKKKSTTKKKQISQWWKTFY
jgi:hypothetical protein